VEAVHEDAYGLPTIRRIEGLIPRYFCADPLSFDFGKDIFQQAPEYLGQTPMSYHFQDVMSRVHRDGELPLIGVPFQPYRKYGFAIWEDKRMADLGMRVPNGGSVFKNYISYCFRWWSILTKEDLR
jgi:hypothetical protein